MYLPPYTDSRAEQSRAEQSRAEQIKLCSFVLPAHTPVLYIFDTKDAFHRNFRLKDVFLRAFVNHSRGAAEHIFLQEESL